MRLIRSVLTLPIVLIAGTVLLLVMLFASFRGTALEDEPSTPADAK